jgi:hypothetical protein
MQTASVALLLKRVSFALIALGFACSLLSLLHIAPKGDRFAALWLGLSGRRQDYTKTGWRLVQSGQVLCVGASRFSSQRCGFWARDNRCNLLSSRWTKLSKSKRQHHEIARAQDNHQSLDFGHVYLSSDEG